ncbi:hypothetical protein T484DRAFT_1829310 [Baffinella frigidus]|nr:hypothetical protein T484DRAFT_1829310 [Cryptophyta sp. CCMP2293]
MNGSKEDAEPIEPFEKNGSSVINGSKEDAEPIEPFENNGSSVINGSKEDSVPVAALLEALLSRDHATA